MGRNRVRATAQTEDGFAVKAWSAAGELDLLTDAVRRKIDCGTAYGMVEGRGSGYVRRTFCRCTQAYAVALEDTYQ